MEEKLDLIRELRFKLESVVSEIERTLKLGGISDCGETVVKDALEVEQWKVPSRTHLEVMRSRIASLRTQKDELIRMVRLVWKSLICDVDI
jgi:hypothetical protein